MYILNTRVCNLLPVSSPILHQQVTQQQRKFLSAFFKHSAKTTLKGEIQNKSNPVKLYDSYNKEIIQLEKILANIRNMIF